MISPMFLEKATSRENSGIIPQRFFLDVFRILNAMQLCQSISGRSIWTEGQRLCQRSRDDERLAKIKNRPKNPNKKCKKFQVVPLVINL